MTGWSFNFLNWWSCWSWAPRSLLVVSWALLAFRGDLLHKATIRVRFEHWVLDSLWWSFFILNRLLRADNRSLRYGRPRSIIIVAHLLELLALFRHKRILFQLSAHLPEEAILLGLRRVCIVSLLMRPWEVDSLFCGIFNLLHHRVIKQIISRLLLAALLLIMVSISRIIFLWRNQAPECAFIISRRLLLVGEIVVKYIFIRCTAIH